MIRSIFLVLFLLSSGPVFAWTEDDRRISEGTYAELKMMREAGFLDQSFDALLAELRARLDEITPVSEPQSPLERLQAALQSLAD